MKKIEWVALILFGWLTAECIGLFAFGLPISWHNLPPIVTTCIVACLTFPKASTGRG